MGNFRFFSKLPKHKKFGFTPRYYNEEKEDLEKRIRAAEAEARAEGRSADEIQKIRFNFRNQERLSEKFYQTSLSRKAKTRVRHQKNMATLRFLVILNILLIAAIYLFVKVF